uniref:Uncharacterized protein n=1 Tax=Chenopodium quinoa TaxID=63459 RepID=A0A803LAX5_CHEQI
MLLKGLKWRVGSGSEIKVWTDSWLPGTPQIIAPLQNGNFDPILRVAALLDARSSVWDVEAPRHYFDEEVCCKILILPIATACTDTRYWWPSKNGEFSVKTAYWLGKMGWGLMSNANQDEDDRRLWRLVWDGSSFVPVIFDAPLNMSFVERMLWLANRLTSSELGMILNVAWSIGFAYASRVFSGSVRAAQQLVSSLVRPPADYLGSFPKEWNVDVAQVAAIRFGCQVARRLGYDSLWVEGDSLTNDTSHGYPPIWLLVDEVPSIAKFFNFYKKDKFVSDDVDTQGSVDDHLDEYEGLKHSSVKCSPKGEDDNKVLSSTSRVDVHPALKKKKLHWGLDAKERWERKANILVGDDPAVCILVDEYWDYFG